MREWWLNISSIARHLWLHRRRLVSRAHKDRRQQTAILIVLGAVAYIFVYAVYFYRNPGGAVLLVLGLAVAFWIRRGHRQDDESFPTLIAAPPIVERDPEPEDEQLRNRAIQLWFLYRRALSELALQQQEGAVHANVVTRRVLLTSIREWQLDEALTAEERHLHFLPDGGWNQDEAVSIVARGAELEALLWAVGSGSSLRPVEDLNVVVSPSVSMPFVAGKHNQFRTRDRHDIRLEANLAFGVWLRVLAELRARGISEEGFSNDELIEASDAMSTAKNDQSADLVLGTKLVTECSDAELRIAFEQSGMRASTLNRFTE